MQSAGRTTKCQEAIRSYSSLSRAAWARSSKVSVSWRLLASQSLISIALDRKKSNLFLRSRSGTSLDHHKHSLQASFFPLLIPLFRSSSPFLKVCVCLGGVLLFLSANCQTSHDMPSILCSIAALNSTQLVSSRLGSAELAKDRLSSTQKGTHCVALLPCVCCVCCAWRHEGPRQHSLCQSVSAAQYYK